MKGRYAQVLTDFWTGKLQIPDTLNTGIRLLALPLPYYLDTEEEAIALIEKFIDELPDVSFSDRLSAGNMAEVSRIVANTVKQVYAGNGGQPDPEVSTEKLKATVEAWKKRGFDPTDKSTWNKASAPQPCVLAPDFCWKPEEVIKVGKLKRLLNVSLQIASDAAKWFLRFVKSHKGEIAVTFVKNMLERFGIKCGHNGKVNSFLDLMRQWDWIRLQPSRNGIPGKRSEKAEPELMPSVSLWLASSSRKLVLRELFPLKGEKKEGIYPLRPIAFVLRGSICLITSFLCVATGY